MKLSNSDLTFLARFARSPDGQVMLRILRAELATRDGELRTLTGEELIRAQGKAQQIDALIKDITEADVRLNRARPPRRVTNTQDPAGA